MTAHQVHELMMAARSRDQAAAIRAHAALMAINTQAKA